jgi:transposase-like protein
MEAVFADLYNRGAEWFDFVVSPFPESTAFDTAAVRMGARTLPSIELGISAASEFFSARARAVAGKKLRFISEARSSQEMVEAVARVAESPWGKDHPDLVERWRSVSSSWHDIFQLPVRSRRTYREADRLGSDLQGVIRRAMKRYRDFANGVDPLRFVLSSLKGAEGKRRRKVLDVGGADSRLVFSHYRSVAGPGLVVIASDLRMGRV